MTLAFTSEAEAVALALSLKVRCQFGHADCPNTPVCDCPALSTPPVENSNPARVPPSGADGQGVCTMPCQLHLDGAVCDCKPVCMVESVNPFGSVNRDKTGTRYVKKGVTADYGGLRLRVQKVRCGVAYCETFFNRQSLTIDCAKLRVVA